jgi:hypothetical protein
MFETFMKHSMGTEKKDTRGDSSTLTKNQMQYETRDRHIVCEIPEF